MTGTSIEDVLPLTPSQEGQLFHAQFGENGPALYTMYFSALRSGPLDVAALWSARAQLLARHQSLRACFRQDQANQMVQVVRRQVTLPWRQVDLSACAEDERAGPLDRLILAARSDRFDLANAPHLYRSSWCGLRRIGTASSLPTITWCWTDGLHGWW
jgi:hypothetical protein